jgi:hypothetical protein
VVATSVVDELAPVPALDDAPPAPPVWPSITAVPPQAPAQAATNRSIAEDTPSHRMAEA